MIKREDGFSLVELMITMIVFVFFIAAASQVFTGLLTQFKQQSKMAETNIEGMVGLEMLRQDIEGAGYGLPWFGLIAYNEADGDPYSLNNSPTTAPRAVLSKNNATFSSPNDIFDGSDYLVIKAVNVGRNDACNKWTTLNAASPYTRTWTPATENLNYASANPYVIVLRPGTTDADARTLVVNGSAFSTTYSGVSSWRSTDLSETRLVYGVDPDTDLRMPFNRADYFIRKYNSSSADITPSRCAPNTGVLEKVVINQSNGGRTNFLPLLDCVADIQVIYGLDLDNDGDFEPGAAGSTDGYSEDITTVPLTAQQIRAQVKQVRVYILSHEGQRDPNYTYCPSSAASCSTAVPVGEFGLGSPFNLSTKIGDPDYKYYRWKLYTIVVTPHNLE